MSKIDTTSTSTPSKVAERIRKDLISDLVEVLCEVRGATRLQHLATVIMDLEDILSGHTADIMDSSAAEEVSWER